MEEREKEWLREGLPHCPWERYADDMQQLILSTCITNYTRSRVVAVAKGYLQSAERERLYNIDTTQLTSNLRISHRNFWNYTESWILYECCTQNTGPISMYRWIVNKLLLQYIVKWEIIQVGNDWSIQHSIGLSVFFLSELRGFHSCDHMLIYQLY